MLTIGHILQKRRSWRGGGNVLTNNKGSRQKIRKNFTEECSDTTRGKKNSKKLSKKRWAKGRGRGSVTTEGGGLHLTG